MDDLVILIGYRAVGKSTVGKRLAKQLGFDFVDTDAEVVCLASATIEQLVAKDGWPAFRSLEKKVLASLLPRRRCVVATGGGAVIHGGIWQKLRSRAVIFWLSADSHTLERRITDDAASPGQRPPLEGSSATDEIDSVLVKRLPLYEKIAHYRIDTDELDREAVVARIRRLMTTRAGLKQT